MPACSVTIIKLHNLTLKAQYVNKIQTKESPADNKDFKQRIGATDTT